MAAIQQHGVMGGATDGSRHWRFDSWLFHFHATISGQVAHTRYPITKQYNLIVAKR